jgi:hypothetical protein
VSIGRNKKARKRIRIVINSAWVSKCQKWFLGPTDTDRYLEKNPSYLANTSATDFREFSLDRGHPKGITFHSFFLAAAGTEMLVGNEAAAPAENPKKPKQKKQSNETGDNMPTTANNSPDNNSPVTTKSPVKKSPGKTKSPVKNSPDGEPEHKQRERGGKTFRNI